LFVKRPLSKLALLFALGLPALALSVFANLAFSSGRPLGRIPELSLSLPGAQEALFHPALERAENPGSPYNVRKSFSELDFGALPDWGSREAIDRAFVVLRGERFLFQRDMPDFARRISWLFPNDGCFARAYTGAQLLRDKGLSELRQVFIFDAKILAKPKWRYGHPNGLPWNYHVALAARAGSEVFVLDPATELERILPLQEWLDRFVVDRQGMNASICGPLTFGPNADCAMESPSSATPGGKTPAQWAEHFVFLEWNALGTQGHDPRKLLGDNPPWTEPASVPFLVAP
jgi:hypothetical protein